MIKADLNNIELTEFIAEDNPGQRCRATFPLLGSHGTRECATVYFELDPGEKLGRHTDSAEEMFCIIDGKVEVIIDEEKGELTQGQLAVVPKMVPHDVRNTGTKKAKVLGFFGGANHIVSTFDEVWSPIGANTVDTSQVV